MIQWRLVVGACTQSRAVGIGVEVQLDGQGQCEVLDKWLVTQCFAICKIVRGFC